MVSLPPPTLPSPVQAALPAAPPPVIVPAQVIAANLQAQLVRELTLPVSAITVTQVPVAPTPPSSAQQILNAATPITSPPSTTPSAAPTQLLLQIQTPQGTVQLSIPAQLALPPTALPPSLQPGVAAPPVPATLTGAQWQQLVDQGHVQLQIAPLPAALLQRLAPGTPPLLAQLIIPPRDLAKLLGTPAVPSTPLAQTPSGLILGTAPSTFTATILPPALAESYKARFTIPAEPPPQPQTSAPRTLQTVVTSVRTWFDAIRPATTPTAQQSQAAIRLEPSLLQTRPDAALPQQLAEPAQAPTTQPTTTLRQVTIALVTQPQSQTQPTITNPQSAQTPTASLPPNTVETPARLLGLTPTGEKLVETQDGQVLLAPAALPIAPGKLATLRLTSPLDANITLQPDRAPTLAITQPALNEALGALAATAPALAARLASQILLQPNAPVGNLAPSLLFLMAAVGINPASAAPGKASGPTLSPALREALDTIDGTRVASPGAVAPPSLAERLLTELRQLGTGREVLDDTGQPWRGFTLPTQLGEPTNNTVQTPINFYIQQPQQRLPDQHNREGANTPAGAVKQTRFIVDMQLSKLGITQLEGLSRARQLDLTLRTHTALPAALQNDLTARYLEIAAATGLTGTLQFGAGRWFTPRETANASHMNARL